MEKGRETVARKMKEKGLDFDFIAQCTGLSIKEVEAVVHNGSEGC